LLGVELLTAGGRAGLGLWAATLERSGADHTHPRLGTSGKICRRLTVAEERGHVSSDAFIMDCMDYVILNLVIHVIHRRFAVIHGGVDHPCVARVGAES